MFARSTLVSVVSLVGLLSLGCGNNSSGDGDEAADSSGTAASTTESGSSGGESEASASSTDTQTTSDTNTASESSTGDTNTSNDTSSSTDTSSESSTDTTSDTGDPMPVGQCVDDCQVPDDCALMDPAFNADNWECVMGGCKWLGCSGDNECNPGFVCHDPGTGVAACVPDCMAPSDCSQGFGPFITSNYTCEMGACVFQGCADDSECGAIGPGWVCTSSTLLPSCVPPCSDASDCASPMPAYDLDNWSCEAGACVWLGCKDGECGKTKVCLLE